MKFFVVLSGWSCMAIQSLAALPSQITLLRGAETEGGGLSTKGKERLAAFVPYFDNSPELKGHGAPGAIYVLGTAKEGGEGGAMEMAKALADHYKLTVITTYTRSDYKKMVDEIKKDADLNGRHVVICWDPSQIPDITRAFGAFQSFATWRKDDYDHVWIVTLAPNGKASFQRLPQRLLFGDSPR